MKIRNPFCNRSTSRSLSRDRNRDRNIAKKRLHIEQLESRRVLASLISEVHIEPLFGNHDTDQYIELRGTPNTSIANGTYFVLLEGWGSVPGGPGYIHSVIDLSGLTYGSNGFLVLAQFGNHYQFDPSATLVQSTTTGFAGLPNNRWSDASTLSDRLAFIFNSGTFLLINAPQAPVPGSDADANDDGLLDGAAANWTDIDSIGLLNTTATPSRSYGRITFSEEPNYLAPAGTLLIDTDGGGYVGRIGASTGWNASDWVSGTTIDKETLDSTIDYSLTFGTFGDPRPLAYSGRFINHVGTYNFDGGVSGTTSLDLNDDGIITSADVPVSGVTVFADANGNNVRDNQSVTVIAQQLPEQSILTNRFPNATLTVADKNNKNIGFAVRTKSTFDPAFNTIQVLSSEGIPWFDSDNRLKVLFYREANFISIDTIAAETLKDSYGKLELYNRDNQLIDAIQTQAMRFPSRQTLSISRAQADIKYAIIYTNNTIANSSPFGKFDNLNYSYPEFQSISDAQGKYSIEELPKQTYNILAIGDTAGKVLINGSTSSYPLTVTKSEHILNSDFGFHENKPPIINTANVSIPENPVVGSIVGQIDAQDPDIGQTLTYAFLSNAGPFGVDATSGAIKVINGSGWDFESTPPILVTLKVSDTFTPSKSTTRTITISPQDVNEAPQITPALFSIPENSSPGTVIGTITATDPDAGIAGTFQFSIDPSGPVTSFTINPNTGVLSVLASGDLDFETQSSWTVPVVARDFGNPPQSKTAQITVRLTDVNDAPTGVRFSNVVDVPESTSTSTTVTVATIQAIDDVLGTNTFSLSGPDAASFSIANGQLRFQSVETLDFETKPTKVVYVSVDDSSIGGTPDATTTFTLAIRDVNEAPTAVEFTNPVTSVPESTNITAGIRIANVRVVDDALGSNGLTLSGPDVNRFTLVGSELRLKSSTPLNFETQSNLKVIVNADDATVGANPDASATFTLSISDVNEPPTLVALDNPLTKIPESPSASTGTKVADVRVVDDALGTNSLILGGSDAGDFEIVNGELKIKAGTLLDFETKSSFSVTVQAVDNTLSSPPTSATSLTVTLSNRPEVLSVTDNLNQPLGSVVKTLRVTMDSLANLDVGAIRLLKTDIGQSIVPTVVNTSIVNNRTVADIQFSGIFSSADGLFDGNYSLRVDGTKIRSSTNSLEGVDSTTSFSSLRPTLPGKLTITGPSAIAVNSLASFQFTLSDITPAPTGTINYKIDFNADGTFDRTVAGTTSLTVPDAILSVAGSFSVLVEAEKDGVTLARAYHVIDVAPTTSLNEKWLVSLDTDRDSTVSPLDALVLINLINSRTGNAPIPYQLSYDVDRDGTVSPLDILVVINYLNGDPNSRVDSFTSLALFESGSAKSTTNDNSISGKITGTSRSLFVTLDNTTKKDASAFVQNDGTFAINDAAIAQLFGTLTDGVHMISVMTQTGSVFSNAMDKRFLRDTSSPNNFQIMSSLKLAGSTRIQWSNAGTGSRYNIYAAPSGSTPTLRASGIASNEAFLSLSAGSHDLFVEAIDGAGNRRQSALVTVVVV